MRLFNKIIRESAFILFAASLLSSLGGFGVENLRDHFLTLLPLLILLPALNGMTGSYGSIVAARFTTLLYEKRVHERNWWKSHELRRLFGEVLIIGTFSAAYVAILASVIAQFQSFAMDWETFQRVLLIALLTTWLLIAVLFAICVMGGFYVYNRKHDPDNYLIPIATGLADLGTMTMLTVLVRALF